jgi:hypothetical protein
MEEKSGNVEELIKRLPEGYEKACYETKGIERKREIKTPEDLIRLALLYLTGGYSQIEMSVIAKELGIGNISDTAFMEKFAKCREWLEWLVSKIKPEAVIKYEKPKSLEEWELTAIDASEVTEKGRSKRRFRLHYAIDIMKMCGVAYKITSEKVGETLRNFDIKEKQLILADRIYGTLTGIEHCMERGANFILRVKHDAFKLYNADGTEINIVDKVRGVTSKKAENIVAYVKLKKRGLTEVRICAMKIPEDKLREVERKDKQKSSKKQKKLSAEAMKMHEYVVVITALPDSVTADEIIDVYGFRWQIELYFKRLKSIMDFGNVPLKREDSIFTWLNGKLLVALLIEQMIAEVSFSP